MKTARHRTPPDPARSGRCTVCPMRRLAPSISGLTLGLLAFTVTFVVRVKADDVWWHLATGERILATLSIPRANTFSFTAPDFPWLAHEWLSEVLFAAVYRLGPGPLQLLAVGLQVAAFALLARLARRDGNGPVAAAWLTAGAALLLLANFSIRPYLLGNLALLLTLLLAERAPPDPARAERGPGPPRGTSTSGVITSDGSTPLTMNGASRRPGSTDRFGVSGGRLALLVALYAAWANLHGSFVFGLGVLGLWALAATVRREQPGRRWAELAVATLACLLTPHHVHGLVFPFTYLWASLRTDSSFLAEILEWQRVSPATPLGLLLLAAFAAAVGVVLRSKLRPKLEHALLFAAFGLAAFSAVRNVALAGVALAVLLPRHLAALTAGRPSTAEALEQATSALVPMGAWAVAALVALVPGPPLATLSPDFAPQGLLAHLARRPPGRLFNAFNWGGALIHAGRPVFIDQRNDCYPPQVLRDYFTVHRLEPGWQEVLDRWQIDAVAWPAGGRLADALDADPRWRVEYEDPQSVLYVRRRSP